MEVQNFPNFLPAFAAFWTPISLFFPNETSKIKLFGRSWHKTRFAFNYFNQYASAVVGKN